MQNLNSVRVAVIGLGYVGLPLAFEFAKHFPVVGFDCNSRRITELISGFDVTLEFSQEELKTAKALTYSADIKSIEDCNVYIVTVPTPVDKYKNPDIKFLLDASRTVGKLLKKGDVVIYESTVYPGATDDDCIPLLESTSGLKLNKDFFVGYSPERINPGDRLRRLPDITKVTSGSTPKAANFIDDLYKKIIKAGTHQAPSIKVAEAAKIIENTQRDVNIALMNELAMIFNKMEIDTESVLIAAGTKWNFMPFRPGLVGGHCIGVDPYYLAHKAQLVGYDSKIILAARLLSDGMGGYVVSQLLKCMAKKRIHINGSRVLIMGFTFKENCPDLRNTRVIDIIHGLKECDCSVDVYDPWVENSESLLEYGVETIAQPVIGSYDAILIAVAHDQFKVMGADGIRALGKPNSIIYDLKYVLPLMDSDLRL